MKTGLTRASSRIVGFMVMLAVMLSLCPFAMTESPPGSISGVVWNDADLNGLRSAEEKPLPNITVQLQNQSDGTVISSTTTDATGAYHFANLAPGYYTLVISAPGMLPTTRNTGNDGIDSDFGMGTGVIAVNVRVKLSADITHLDAGLYTPGSGSGTAIVSGYLWRDSNRNGLMDPGEPMKPGVWLRCTTGEGQSARTTTWWDGYYEFDFASLTGNFGGAPIWILLPGHFRLTQYQVNSGDTDSDFHPLTMNATGLTLTAGSPLANINAGLCRIFPTPTPVPLPQPTPTSTPSEPDIPPDFPPGI